MHDLALSHYSKDLALKPRSVKQKEVYPYSKPLGLWLSVDGPDDWPEWCLAEDFRLDALRYKHIICLSDSAKVLVLATVHELDAFHSAYKKIYRYPNSDYTKWCIPWGQVAKDYDGIIIAPYQYSRRLDTPVHDWYYTWDCASGCIWNAQAIRVVDTVKYKVEADA